MPLTFKTQFQRKFGWLTRIKLNFVFLGVAIFSVLVAETVWVVPTFLTKENNLYERVEERARIAVIAAIEDANFEDVAFTEKIGERLIRIGDILGGAIYDSEGSHIGRFGEYPSLSWISARKEGYVRYRDPTACCLDVLLAPEQTGIENDLILRLDITKLNREVQSHLSNLAIMALINALVCCFSIVGLLYYLVSRPVAKLARAAAMAAKEPQNASQYVLNWKRNDELGDLAEAINILAEKTASVYRNELYVAKQVMYRTRLAIIHFNPKGRVIAANRAALRLFDSKDLSAMRQANPKMMRFENKLEGDPVDVIESLTEGSYVEAGYALTKQGEIPCIISASLMVKANGDPLRYAATFVPALDYANEIKKLEGQLADRETEAEEQKRQWAAMRLVSEIYDDILESRNKAQPGQPKIEDISIQSSTDHWLDHVRELGLMVELEWENEAPKVRADKIVLNDAYRRILSFIFLRSEFENPMLTIKVQQTSQNTVELTVTDISLREGRNYLPIEYEQSHWKHVLPMVANTLRTEGGELLDANVRQGSPNEISFRWPLNATQANAANKGRKVDSAAA